jgi:hypothetical protein
VDANHHHVSGVAVMWPIVGKGGLREILGEAAAQAPESGSLCKPGAATPGRRTSAGRRQKIHTCPTDSVDPTSAWHVSQDLHRICMDPHVSHRLCRRPPGTQCLYNAALAAHTGPISGKNVHTDPSSHPLNGTKSGPIQSKIRPVPSRLRPDPLILYIMQGRL